MKYIEDMYHDKISITETELYQRIQKDEFEISYDLLKTIIKRFDTISHDTIVNTLQTIKINTARFKIFMIMNLGADQSRALTLDVGAFIAKTIQQLDDVAGVTSSTGEDLDDILDQIIMQTQSIASGKTISYYKTGVKEIDKKLPIRDDNIILVGGPAKHGKSKFVKWLIYKLLENNPGVFAIKWYSFEENADEVARKFIAADTLMTDAEITGVARKLSAEDVDKIVKSANKFKKLPIKIEHKPKNIKQVEAEFGIFVKKHSNKVPILIIDNLMLLTDVEFDRDDKIMNTINHIKQRTKAIIFPIHHFNDDQQKDEREKDAFRPVLKDLKGRESFRRVPKVILLINYPYKYAKIKNKYKNRLKHLKNMFIVDIAAIRNMGDVDIEGAGQEEDNLIHFYTHLGINHFYPLSDLHKNNPELNN